MNDESAQHLTRSINCLTAALNDGHCKHETNAILNGLAEMEKRIMKEFDDLETQVTTNTSAVESAIVLINGIADRIAAAGTDPAKLAALTASLKKEDDALAAAVLANTPAAPPV